MAPARPRARAEYRDLGNWGIDWQKEPMICLVLLQMQCHTDIEMTQCVLYTMFI